MLGFRRRKDSREVWLNVSNRTILRVIALILLAFLGVAFLRRAEHALLLIFLAFLLAIALNNPVRLLANHLPGKIRGSRLIATMISYLLVLAVLGVIIALAVPPLVRQTDHFINVLPSVISDAKSQHNSLSEFIQKHHLQKELQDVSNQVGSFAHHATSSALSAVVRVASSAVSLLTILVLTFMMLVEAPGWSRQMAAIIPKEHKKHVFQLGEDMAKVVRGYVNGQVLLAAIAAGLITPALFILHINYPLALMVLVFIAGLIPLVGHTIGAVIVSAVALFSSPVSALIILAYYILYINIENYVLAPNIQSSTTNLSPLLVIMAIVVGVTVGGLFGGLLAIPLAGCLRVLVVDYLKDQDNLLLGEDATASPPTGDSK